MEEEKRLVQSPQGVPARSEASELCSSSIMSSRSRSEAGSGAGFMILVLNEDSFKSHLRFIQGSSKINTLSVYTCV